MSVVVGFIAISLSWGRDGASFGALPTRCQPARDGCHAPAPAPAGVRHSALEATTDARTAGNPLLGRSRWSRWGARGRRGSKRQAPSPCWRSVAAAVDVDGLIEGLWGEELPSAPRNALHHHVARLRATLARRRSPLPDGYALGNGRVDALRFEELLADTRAALRDGDLHGAAATAEEALGLWRGRRFRAPGHGVVRRRSPTPGGAARRRTGGALRGRTRARRAQRADPRAPLRARGESVPRAGVGSPHAGAVPRRPAGRGLETFQEARRVLGEELGLEPGPDLRRLQEAILAHDPAIAAVAAAGGRRGNLPHRQTSFVGRGDDLDRAAALMRQHRLVTLTGPPGVGKTRLAVEVAHALEAISRRGVARRLRPRGERCGRRPAARERRRCPRLRPAGSRHVAAARRDRAARPRRLRARARGGGPARGRAPRRLRRPADPDDQPRGAALAGEVRVPVEPLGQSAVELFLERARAGAAGFEPDDEQPRWPPTSRAASRGCRWRSSSPPPA